MENTVQPSLSASLLATVPLSESQLRRLLRSYITYYNRSRCHMALDGDAPQHRDRQETIDGPVVAIPQVGGLHHRYVRAT